MATWAIRESCKCCVHDSRASESTAYWWLRQKYRFQITWYHMEQCRLFQGLIDSLAYNANTLVAIWDIRLNHANFPSWSNAMESNASPLEQYCWTMMQCECNVWKIQWDPHRERDEVPHRVQSLLCLQQQSQWNSTPVAFRQLPLRVAPAYKISSWLDMKSDADDYKQSHQHLANNQFVKKNCSILRWYHCCQFLCIYGMVVDSKCQSHTIDDSRSVCMSESVLLIKLFIWNFRLARNGSETSWLKPLSVSRPSSNISEYIW